MSDERTGRNGVKRRLTIRMRLTLSYSGLITGSGAALITLVYLYMRFVPNYQIVPNDGIPSAEDGAFGPAQTTDGIAINSADDFLENLLVASAIALIVLALLGGLAGWLVAGRIVKPLSEIGSAARRAASGALDHRVGLDGPHDEVQDLANTFDQMLASLERSFATQRRFTANASHELQSPLATIKTMIEVIEPDADADIYRGLVRRINEVNQSNIETVDALLELATANNAPVDLETFDLAALARTIVQQLSLDAQAAEVALECSGGEATVTGNIVLIRQALSNLARNAIHHNHVGGRASLQVTSTQEHARVTVINSGPVLSSEELGVLTEPFARGGGRGLTRGSGHGLGLAIVSAALEANCGTLELTPNPAGGLTATVDLPLDTTLGSGQEA